MGNNKYLFNVDPKQFNKWKRIKYNPCKCNISLWVGLSKEHINAMCDDRPITDIEWRTAVLSYPYDTKGCSCKMCRYRRWFGKK